MHYQIERTDGCRISDAWTYRGLKTVVLENELIKVTVLADKGADIYEFIHKPTDTDFMWRTPWGVRDPRKFIPTTGSPEAIWLDVYEGGWQTLAPTAGSPATYAGAEIGQHSEATTMPWDVQIIDDTRERVSARFWVRTYRTPFFIEKTLSIEADSPVLTIDESIMNEAEDESEAVWGQHIALGAPFLSENCRLDIPGGKFIVPGEGIESERRLRVDQTGEWPLAVSNDGDEIDLHDVPPRTDRVQDYMAFTELVDGWYALTNPDRRVGFAFVFPKETYRYLWYWQVFGGGRGYPWYRRNYNVGLEPFTSLSNGMPMPGSDEPTSLQMAAGERRSITMKAVAYVPPESATGVKSVSESGAVSFL